LAERWQLDAGRDRVVRVRLFAALRELAGASEVEAEGRTAGEVADALSARFGERFGQIAAVGSLVVNGERAARATPVAEGDEVALLPPVSGGGMVPGRGC
jgi:MoaD family protein